MFSKFLSLEPEKRERILNAAFDEFSKKSYKNASTNEIVKQAGISKGLLFHYFKNKQELFWFLFDYSMDIMKNDLYEKIDVDEKDILIRLKQISQLKFDIYNKYPQMYNFVLNAYYADTPEIKMVMAEKCKELIEESQFKAMQNIDMSVFKEEFTPEQAVNIILWILEGFANQAKDKIKKLITTGDYEEIFNEAESYLQIIRKLLYK